jgi:hypothetical protein
MPVLIATTHHTHPIPLHGADATLPDALAA